MDRRNSKSQVVVVAVLAVVLLVGAAEAQAGTIGPAATGAVRDNGPDGSPDAVTKADWSGGSLLSPPPRALVTEGRVADSDLVMSPTGGCPP